MTTTATMLTQPEEHSEVDDDSHHDTQLCDLMARMSALGGDDDEDDDEASHDFSNEDDEDDGSASDSSDNMTELQERMQALNDTEAPAAAQDTGEFVNTMKKTLSWSSLTVREYPYVLGDGCAVFGPPISVDWHHQSEHTFNLEKYEAALEKAGGTGRRTQSEMKIPSRIRTEILTKHGHTKKEIQAAIKSATITKNQRKKTVSQLQMQPMEQFFEKASRGARRKIFRKTKSDLSPFFAAPGAVGPSGVVGRQSTGSSGTMTKSAMKEGKTQCKVNPKKLVKRHSM